MKTSRRTFLRTAAVSGAGTTLVPSWLAGATPPVGDPASPARLDVRFDDELEPLVRLIEETPREQAPAMLLQQIRRGATYRQCLSALFLAGIRDVNPQPPGFKFHCVFAIHAAHTLAMETSSNERWYPLFWALDEFKQSQAADVKQGDFRLRAVTGELPASGQAWAEWDAAMARWDEAQADRAITALVRTQGAHAIMDRLWAHGARDYRNIGHKAIYVANAWRTLQTIGWRHAEPVLRSVVLALLDFKDREVNGFAFSDQCYAGNVERARGALPRLPSGALAGAGDPGVTREVLSAIRSGQVAGACDLVITLLNSGRGDATSVWDATHLAACELMMRQPGIFGIHTVTSSNALHYAFRHCGPPEQRLLLLLQGVGWMVQFHQFMQRQPAGLGPADLLKLEPAPIPEHPAEAAASILSKVGRAPANAAREAMGFARRFADSNELNRQARSLIFRKKADPHHYKYSVAVQEDGLEVSARWRPHVLASMPYFLLGPDAPDSPLILGIRDDVARLG